MRCIKDFNSFIIEKNDSESHEDFVKRVPLAIMGIPNMCEIISTNWITGNDFKPGKNHMYEEVIVIYREIPKRRRAPGGGVYL